MPLGLLKPRPETKGYHRVPSISMPTATGEDWVSKVPQATLWFWLIKICATTVGETGGDALSMTLKLGYAVSSLIFLGFFIVTVAAQVGRRRFRPLVYWAVVVATTTVGTTTSDFLDRSLGLGYILSSIFLALAVVVVLIAWKLTTGAIVADRVTSRRDEAFYWLTILVSNTLGTALGDFAADDLGLGFGGGAILFALLIALVAAAYFFTRVPKPILFWAAYVLTRPLGATLGDTLTKPVDHGGLDLGAFASSWLILAIMVVLVAATETWRRKRPTHGSTPH